MLDPAVWGPHYWFVLHTIALTYPTWPTDVAKRKYYEFVQNLPLFLPQNASGGGFSEFLDRYPVTPYLDSRASFRRWVHFIHNKINVAMGRPELTDAEADAAYSQHYAPPSAGRKKVRDRRRLVAVGTVIGGLLVVAAGVAAHGEIFEL
jgi:hypothetical protein